MTRTEVDRILEGSRHAIHLADDLPEPHKPLHPYVFLRTYGRQCERMRRFVDKANASRERLQGTVKALHKLMAVDAFRALLKAEGFATMPGILAQGTLGDQSGTPGAWKRPGHTIAAGQELVIGICTEAVDLLEDCGVHPKIFGLLRKVVPSRQVEITQLMIALDRVKVHCAKVFVALTPQSQLAEPSIPRKQFAGIDAEQLAAMETEFAELSEEFLNAAKSHGARALELVAAQAYLDRLMENPRVVRFLARKFPERVVELQKLLDQI
ncbi:hypothetical protein AU467_06795 [Mesorhizobium loti]|uniref:RepB plasmid partition domain-containing protein n=1 Tax=Rhizobium loti TaxID=381 RepID=A0A101KNL8_RHILI|nr:hypothetical protein AU467_06795 [Mesorhizobium loti]